jgi:hypothetical protein
LQNGDAYSAAADHMPQTSNIVPKARKSFSYPSTPKIPQPFARVRVRDEKRFESVWVAAKKTISLLRTLRKSRMVH